MLISRNEAESLITPDIAIKLAYCTAMAFNSWFSGVKDEDRAICNTTAKATYINDHMIYYARQIFDKNPDVRIITVNGRVQLLIKERIQFKLKKLNKHLKPSAIPTRTAIHYDSQLIPPEYDHQLHFDGMVVPDDIAHLIAGYQENVLKTDMQPYIVCPNGRYNHWVWPLEFTDISIPQKAVSPQFPPDDKQTGLKPKSVTPKNLVQETVE
jgi:hypothetical protein